MANKLGKRPATYDARDILFADVKAGANITVPSPKGGYGTDFTDWLMLGNGPCDDGTITEGYAANGAGDCAWAGPSHTLMEAAHNAKRAIPRFTCASVLTDYAKYLGLAGYSALNENNDQGTDVREMLARHQSVGLTDADGNVYKILKYIKLELGNFTELWEALYLFESVGMGFNFPESAMDQFNSGKGWSVVSGAQIEGGHYVPIVGHPSQNVWTCVTWGKRQTMTPQFITKYADEFWTYIDPLMYSQVTGKTLENETDADLEQIINELAQAKS